MQSSFTSELKLRVAKNATAALSLLVMAAVSLAVGSIAATASSYGQTAQPSLASAQPARLKWSAMWISHPTAPLREPITLHFKRTFSAPPGSKHFIIHVSADNRFVLYLNGKRIGDGPARGDLEHWRYETFDLAANLLPGKNTLTATVWNFGIYIPVAQFTDRTAFLVEGDTPVEAIVNTDDHWMVEVEPGHTAYPRQPNEFRQYMASGPAEMLNAAEYDWNWQSDDTSSGRWVAAASAMRESSFPSAGIAGARGVQTDNPWELVPDQLPPMSYTAEAAGETVRSELPDALRFPAQPVTVPANTHVHILLDRASLTTAYPQLVFSGGKGSRVDITYAEALYDAKQKKGDRNEVGTRHAAGVRDRVLPDGGDQRTFETLWWRTWRYLDLDVTTASEPLRLESLRAAYTAYPFHKTASFHSSDPELNTIWEIGWHTVELDAHETYMDTPYYEQLQYVGDARIEAMITYAVSDDDRLAQQAIRAINDSRRAEGLTASRYPSSLPQYIPPFSLLWIGMVHDFAQYHSDVTVVREAIGGTRTVLAWFQHYEQPNGLLTRLPNWSFIDWTSAGEAFPSYDASGQSCLVTLQYLGALEQASELERVYGQRAVADDYSMRVAHTKEGILKNCWDSKVQFVADSPSKTIFSQHANALAVLYDVIPKEKQVDVLTRTMAAANARTQQTSQPPLIEASYYFDYYLARALDHAGMGDDYEEILGRWRALLKLHFSTWPETPGDSRSDSHAWSAHPTYDLLTLVAGIKPAMLGFESVRIEPHLGHLTALDATVPHAKGDIHVQYRMETGDLSATITLPDPLTGTFIWNGHTKSLHGGVNTLHLKP